MKAVIVEDELQTQQFLRGLLETNYEDMEITACLDSVQSCVSYFSSHNVDLIFMDIQLKDGYCFSIFEQVEVDALIIFTTAYNEYALKAFEQNSIAYLLKPLTVTKIQQAMTKYYNIENRRMYSDNILKLLKYIKADSENKNKSHFVVKQNSSYIIIKEQDIAYFISKNKIVFLHTKDDERYIVNYTLDSVLKELNPKRFYKISRNCVCSIDSMVKIEKYKGGRLQITVQPEYTEDKILVAREATAAFISWIEQ